MGVDRRNALTLVRMLVEAGADPNLTNKCFRHDPHYGSGRTALGRLRRHIKMTEKVCTERSSRDINYLTITGRLVERWTTGGGRAQAAQLVSYLEALERTNTTA